jgi:hypothetical protein
MFIVVNFYDGFYKLLVLFFNVYAQNEAVLRLLLWSYFNFSNTPQSFLVIYFLLYFVNRVLH